MSLFNTSNAARHVPRKGKTKTSPKKVSWKDKSKHHRHIQSHQTDQKQQIQVVQNGIRRKSHVPQAPSGKNATPLDYNRTGPLAGKKKKKEVKKQKQQRRHAIVSMPLSIAVNKNRLGNNNKNRGGSNVLNNSMNETMSNDNEKSNQPDLQDQFDSFEFDLRGTTIDSLSVKPAEFNFGSIVQDIEHSNVFKTGTPVKKGTLMGKIENYDSIRGVYVIMYDTGVWEEMTEEDIRNKLGLSFKGSVMEQAI